MHRLLGGALCFTIFVVDEAIDDPVLSEIVDVVTAGLADAHRQLR